MTEAEENAAVAEIAKQLEAEGLAAEGAGVTNFGTCVVCGRPCIGQANSCPGDGRPEYPRCNDCYATWASEPQLPGVIPLTDLRERIAILTAAGVTHYRDAGVELHFDLEAQKRTPENKLERF